MDEFPDYSHNRNGDPRQLRHEADYYEAMAKQHRKDAVRRHEEGRQSDRVAAHYERVGRDYRRWAEEGEQRAKLGMAGA